MLHSSSVPITVFFYFINISQDEDLYKAFATDKPEMGVEAIRVPRDPQTSISKGFGFVLFKTKVRISLDMP